MWSNHSWRLAVAVLFSAIAACSDDDDDDGGNEPETQFEATLSGGQEVPPVGTPASGSATISIEESQIAYRVDVVNLENAVVSHIHIAPPGEIGPVRLDLCGTPAVPACTSGSGTLVEGATAVLWKSPSTRWFPPSAQATPT